MIIETPQFKKVLERTELTDGLFSHDTYTSASFQNQNWNEQEVDDVIFEQCQFKQVIMNQSKLKAAQFIDVIMNTCDLGNAELVKLYLRRVEVHGSRMMGARIINADIRDVVIKGSNIQFAQFTMTKFKSVRFEGCNLTSVDFSEADLSGVIFNNCDLTGSGFSDAKLVGTDFRGSKIKDVRAGPKELRGAIVDYEQALSIVRLLGIRVDLTGSGLLLPEEEQ